MTQRNTDRFAPLRRAAAGAPMLEAEEEQALIRRAQQDGDERATHRLVAAHLRLVLSVAKSYARGGVSLDDLVSEGSVGLLEAIRRFDPQRGTRFSTYAVWWVRAHIRRYAMANRRIVPAPSTRNARRILGALHRTRKELEQRTGAAPTRDEIAAALDVTAEEIAMVETALAARDVVLGPLDDGTHHDVATSLPSPEQEAAEHQLAALRRRQIADALGVLSEREREIVERRILNEDSSSLASLGAHFGVSRERVRQIQQRAQNKLRSVLLEQVA